MQEVSVRSWGSRLAGALVGFFVGLALLVGAVILVFWNEGHGLHTAQALQRTGEVLVRVAVAPIDPRNNLQPIYFTGLATTSEVLRDPLLDVAQQALRLERRVEMYQWQEHTESETQKQWGGSEQEVRTYHYKPGWSVDWIDSRQFKDPEGHENPADMPIQSRTQQAKKVKVGDFSLPPSFVNKMTDSTLLDLSALSLDSLAGKFKKKIQHLDYKLYVGEDPQRPAIGDLKITVYEVLPQTVSVIAQQIGRTIQPYTPLKRQSVGLLVLGTQTPEAMIQQAEVENKTFTRVLRLVAFLAMVAGFYLLLRPAAVLADVVPFLGTLVAFGLGLIAWMGGLLLWTISTALAWFTVRPLWSLTLIFIACFLIVVLFFAPRAAFRK